jgi:hypothetical protein
MKKKIIGLLICFMLVSLIPLAAGTVSSYEDEKELTEGGLFGWAWVRGWIMNPRELGGYLSGRAIRLHFIEFSGLETKFGIIKLKLVNFKTGPFVKVEYLGPLCTIAHVKGFVHGGIEIQGEN